MKDVKELLEGLQADVNHILRKTVKSVEKNTKDITDSIAVERKKVAIRSQIGQHQRNTAKAYARLGEAYYQYVEKGQPLTGIDDILDILRSNNKVIQLLEEQLKTLESSK